MTDWYSHLAKAKYVGAKPWELDGLEDTKDCVMWGLWAVEAMNCEGNARESKEKRSG